MEDIGFKISEANSNLYVNNIILDYTFNYFNEGLNDDKRLFCSACTSTA